MPVSEAFKIFLDHERERRNQANLDRAFGLDQVSSQQRQESIDLAKLAEANLMKRHEEDQARLLENALFARTQAGQAGIASGALEPAAPLPVTRENAAMITLPGAPTHEAGGLNYGPGLGVLKAVPKAKQEEQEVERAIAAQQKHRDAFNLAFDDFVAANPDFASTNRDRIDEAKMAKLLGLPLKDETISNIGAEAARRWAKVYADGIPKTDPRYKSAAALTNAYIRMTEAARTPMLNPLAAYNLGSEHDANRIAQVVDAEILKEDPMFHAKAEPIKNAARRSKARDLVGKGVFTSEAGQRYQGGLGAEPQPKEMSFLDRLMAEAAEAEKAKKAAAKK